MTSQFDFNRFYVIILNSVFTLGFLTQEFQILKEELRSWKLSVKIKLLLIVELKYVSNPLGMTFILRLNLPSCYIIRWES